MKKYKVAVLGLRMGGAWAKAAYDLPGAELTMVYDPAFEENNAIDIYCPRSLYHSPEIRIAASEDEIYSSDADIVVVASPDHFHTEQAVKALDAGKHVVCEKPLAPTVNDCRKIIAAVKRSQRQFMTGQVCRYAPAFRLAKTLLDSGRIGELVYLETEYAHDYSLAPGFGNWRRDPAVARQGFLGGGCHALDLARFLAGNPEEVFCYMNRKHLPDWPAPDTGVAVAKFPEQVIGRVFVSIGVKRPYTMRTVINGTKGTIICDNTTDYLRISEEDIYRVAGKSAFTRIPVKVDSHCVQTELSEFISALQQNIPIATDVYEGTATVAFAEAAINSARLGQPQKPLTDFYL